MEHLPPLVVGLDIGTTKISVIVAARNQFGKIEVLGVGKSESLGVMRGVVANIEKTVQSISQAIGEASNKSEVEIRSVIVGIAGQHIKSLQHRGMRTRNSLEDEISMLDIDAIIDDMYKLAMLPGEEILHVIPQEYTVDNEQGIADPIGMSGIRLEANCHIVTGQMAAGNNIRKCVNKAGLELVDMILEPIASAEAVLADEEKEAGVVLVDIGGGTTDIAIFQDKILRHTAVIPFGGNIITEDIREGCGIIKAQAEQLKMRFGSALAIANQDNEIVSIPGLRGREPKEISLRNLASIIQARMEEIAEHVDYEIRSAGYNKNKLSAGIVLTGGGAQLKHIKHLFEQTTGMDVRLGFPNEHLGKGAELVQSPIYATGVGLAIMGFQKHDKDAGRNKPNTEKEAQQQHTPVQPTRKEGSFFEKLLKKSSEWLNEETDKSI